MAKRAAHGARIWLAQYDLSGYLNSFALNVNQETPDVACFGDAGPRVVAGNYNHDHSHNGFFDAATGAIDPAVWATLGNSAGALTLAHLPEGATEGLVAYEGLVELTAQPRSGGSGGAVLTNISAAGGGGLGRGQVIRAGTITGTGNGTGYNLGATTSGQVLAIVFRVFSGTFSSLALKIQESQNDGSPDTYADVSGLVSGTISAAGVVRVTTTAATEAWKRVVVSSFSGTNALIGVTAVVVAP